ncbi:MAG TPA: hypothetical protein VN457_01440 [Chlamydiales bacterium]|nr:hypothetical protein [Chlamydiales bacterium]
MLAHHPESAAIALPDEFKKETEQFVDWILQVEEKEYKSDLKPFPQHAQEVKDQVQKYCLDLRGKLLNGQRLLKARFSQEEQENPLLCQQFSFASLEEQLKKLEERKKNPELPVFDFKTLQAQLEIPWSFMDRGFATGTQFLQDKCFDEAYDIFFLLRFLQPRIFEYWVCEATCLHELGKLEEAIKTYEMSLVFQPKNPLVFFQLASCLFRLNEKSAALKSFETCIKYAEENPQFEALCKEAKEIKTYLQQHNK